MVVPCHKSCTVRLVVLGSVITKNCTQVTYFLLYVGVFSYVTRKRVLVSFTLSPTPCTIHPNSLSKYSTHVFLCLSHLIRRLYSRDAPVSLLIIDFASIFRYW